MLKQKKGKSTYVCRRDAGIGEAEVKSVVICGRGRGGSQACPKERKLCGPQFRSFSSSYPILSFSLHLLRKSSYEPLIPNRVYYDDRRSLGRGCVCVRVRCTPVEATHSATSLRPLTFSLQPRGMRGLVWEIECVQWVCPAIRSRASKEIFQIFRKEDLKDPRWSTIINITLTNNRAKFLVFLRYIKNKRGKGFFLFTSIKSLRDCIVKCNTSTGELSRGCNMGPGNVIFT